jgi:predicted HicB family RNase H-like nuclease
MANEVLQHRGYIGSVEIDLEEKNLFGSVQFIQGAISYDGETVSQLQSSFLEAVDSYVAACQRRGVDPIKPFSGTFQIRPGPEIHREAAIAAFKSAISLNEWVKNAILEKLEPSESPVHSTHAYQVNFQTANYYMPGLGLEFSTFNWQPKSIQGDEMIYPRLVKLDT